MHSEKLSSMFAFVYLDFFKSSPLPRKLALKCIRNKIPHSVFSDQPIPKEMFEGNENVIVITKNAMWEKGSACRLPPVALICFDEKCTDNERLNFINNLLLKDF